MAASFAAVPEVSIVIGTLDRCEMLERAIRSILDQAVDASRYEIVVVDNGSTDRTREVVAEIQRHAPQVRYVQEPQLGLSRARNRGIAEGRADIIGFFDDDGTAEPGWLATMLEVFRREPDTDALGGKIRVAWPANQPSWMPMELQGYYAGCDYGPTPRVLAYPDYPYGPNMMIRRPLLQSIGGFNAAVGPQGRNIMSAGEQDLFQRLYQHPIKVLYEPAAVVRHWVPADRATRKWLLHRAYKHGFSNTRMISMRTNRSRLKWLTLLLRSTFKAADACVSGAIGSLVRSGPPVVTARFARMNYWVGVARGAIDGVLYGERLAPALH